MNSLLFLAVWLLLLAALVVRQVRKGRVVSRLAVDAAKTPVVYRERLALVRVREGRGRWVDVKTGMGAVAVELRVRRGYIEVGFVPPAHRFGSLLGCEWVLPAAHTTMRQEVTGWGGTRIAERDCTVLRNDTDYRGGLELALATIESPDTARQALVHAGVLPD